MRRLLFTLLLLVPWMLSAQTGFYIPGNTRVKDMRKALQQPDQFALLLQFSPADTALSLNHLDWLDSAYGIAFDAGSRQLSHSSSKSGIFRLSFSMKSFPETPFLRHANMQFSPAIKPETCLFLF